MEPMTIPFHRPFRMGLVLATLLPTLSAARVLIRGNTLGYPAARMQKTLIVLADSTQRGKSWQLQDGNGKVAKSGTLGDSLCGATRQSPFAFNYAIELGGFADTGVYRLSLSGASSFEVRIRANPYSFFAEKALGHLRLMRSGPDQHGIRNPSHLGDTACIPQKPLVAGDGSWTTDGTRAKLNLAGGWYDAGDYIKFTTTNAQTVYFLLRAWETDSGLFGRSSGLLDEARFGLEFLLRTHPDDSTFVIQVGDAHDHEQGARLPENDLLDGKRPALCAISPSHMGLASAALALGASVFRGGDAAFARVCSTQAVRILEHGSGSGVARTSYFSGSDINAFYQDNSLHDNLGMGAAELWRLTGEARWKTLAQRWSDSAGAQGWVNWESWAMPLNGRLAGDSAPAALLGKDLQGMANYGTRTALPWNLPMPQYWDPIEPYLSWIGIAAERALAGDTSWIRQAWDVWDYVLGRNNWGTSFLISKNIPGHASAIYNQIYRIEDVFPEGAISLGPGATSSFTSMRSNFQISQAELDSVGKLNGKAAVFYDNSSVFLNTETTIGNEATFVFALAALSRLVGDSVPGVAPDSVEEEVSAPLYTEVPFGIDKSLWSVDVDSSYGGSSKASLDEASDSLVRATFTVTVVDSVGYGFAYLWAVGFPDSVRSLGWSGAVGVRVRGDLPKGHLFWLEFPTDSILDFDYHGQWVVGKGDTTYDIVFRDFAQRGFGKTAAFVPAQVHGFEIMDPTAAPTLSVGVRSLSLLYAGSVGTKPSSTRSRTRSLWASGNKVCWSLSGSNPATLWLLEPDGRRKLLAREIAPTGSIALPGSNSGIRFVLLEQAGNRQAVPFLRAR